MGILKKVSDAIFYTPKKEKKEGDKIIHSGYTSDEKEFVEFYNVEVE